MYPTAPESCIAKGKFILVQLKLSMLQNSSLWVAWVQIQKTMSPLATLFRKGTFKMNFSKVCLEFVQTLFT